MWWLGIPVSGELQTSSESLEVGFFNIEEALNLIENNDYKDISEAGFDLFRKDSKDFKLWDFWLAVMRGKSNKSAQKSDFWHSLPFLGLFLIA
ncbi:hypothetical protein LIT25_16005 [Bacillus sp. F19]|nr:hypothetical protein LIT25_16005 [Bacillus sp. F19]